MASKILPHSRHLPSQLRYASLKAPPSQTHFPPQIFNRYVKLLQRDRAAAKENGKSSRRVDYVREEIADRLYERFQDIRREFSTVLDLGATSGHFSKLFPQKQGVAVTMIDMSPLALYRDPGEDFDVELIRRCADEERLLDVVSPETVDAVVSCLSLHWINDLPGVLHQIKQSLKPDGVFIAAMFGGDTLFELRTSLQLAEVEREGGISPRVSPMTDTRDVSNLLARAGFTLLTVDIDHIQVNYPSMWDLVKDLQDMGESSAIHDRRPFLRRDTLISAASIYQNLHANSEGIPATFEVIFMIGWKPGPNQPKPLVKGSADQKLKNLL